MWTKTCYERFDFGRDLRFADELNRFIIEHELASEPLPACSEFQFVGSKAFAVEGQTHAGTILVAKYLKVNPAEVENFLDFDAIHWTKVLERIKASSGLQMDPESAANLKTRNDAARKKFRQDRCKECGRTPQLSWTAKDTDTLAKEVDLADQYVFCFLEPTQLLHCTWYGLRPLYSQDFSTRLPAILEAVHLLLIIGIMLHQDLYDEGPQSDATSEVYAAWRKAWLLAKS